MDTESYGRKESPKAAAAFERYWDMGPARSLEKLCAVFHQEQQACEAWKRLPSAQKTHQTAPKAPPTTSIDTLKEWSSEFQWQERILTRMQKEADLAEARAVEEMKEHKKRRIAEAHGLRGVGAAILGRITRRLAAGDIDKLPLLPTVEMVPFHSKRTTTNKVTDPETGKAKIVEQTVEEEGVRPMKQLSLFDLLPDARKAIEVGQKLDRAETGDDKKKGLVALIEGLMDGMSEEEKAAVRAMAAEVAQRQG